MDNQLERIQDWMKESKFAEAEKALSAILIQSDRPTLEVLDLFAQSILEQKRVPPSKVLIDLAELEFDQHLDKTEYWLSFLTPLELEKHHREVQFLRIRLADKKGRVDQLHELLSAYQIYLFEKKKPAIPGLIHEMIEKYFKDDFSLRLQQLSLTLMLSDLEHSEKILKRLLLSSVEKASSRGLRNKVEALASVLDATFFKGYLEVYRGLCTLLLDGVTDTVAIKKLVEFIIYTDDFKFQVLALDILHKNNLEEIAGDYSVFVREHKDYDFVYFEKYYTHLKAYFVMPREKEEIQGRVRLDVDLTLTEKAYKTDALSPIYEDSVDDESRIITSLKYHDFTDKELFELATSFIQANMPKAAQMAVERILRTATNDETHLKANYLRLTCLLLLGDYRAALDCSLSALDKAKTKDDILSFLYGRAEAYIRLNQIKEAKIVLKEILSIDSSYRLTRERLEKIDEI